MPTPVLVILAFALGYMLTPATPSTVSGEISCGPKLTAAVGITSSSSTGQSGDVAESVDSVCRAEGIRHVVFSVGAALVVVVIWFASTRFGKRH